MYVNGKMRLVEPIQEGKDGVKENDGGSEFNIIYLIYYKNFCKCHNVTTAQYKTK
jgi:hypothetical protein